MMSLMETSYDNERRLGVRITFVGGIILEMMNVILLWDSDFRELSPAYM
jgi:hypothetical protein